MVKKKSWRERERERERLGNDRGRKLREKMEKKGECKKDNT